MKKKTKIFLFVLIFILFGFGLAYSPTIIDYIKNENTSKSSLDNEINKDTTDLESNINNDISKNISNNNTGSTIKENIIINKTPEQIKKTKEILDLKETNNNIDKKTIFSTNEISSNINNLIEILGNSDIKYIQIGTFIFEVFSENNKLYFGIDMGTLDNGTYEVYTIDKNNNKIKTNITFKANYTDTSLNIANITPNSIKNDSPRYLVIQGNGFNKVISIQLNNNIILQQTTFQVVNDKVMMIKIPEKLTPGTYYFNIMTTDAIFKLDKNTFTITN